MWNISIYQVAPRELADLCVKESLTRDFCFQVFFHESLSPGALGIPWGSFQIFTTIRGDSLKQRLITGVNGAAAAIF